MWHSQLNATSPDRLPTDHSGASLGHLHPPKESFGPGHCTSVFRYETCFSAPKPFEESGHHDILRHLWRHEEPNRKRKKPEPSMGSGLNVSIPIQTVFGVAGLHETAVPAIGGRVYLFFADKSISLAYIFTNSMRGWMFDDFRRARPGRHHNLWATNPTSDGFFGSLRVRLLPPGLPLRWKCESVHLL